MNEQRERIKVLSAGIFSLILVLGVARFSYTPLLPLMQQQAGLGIAEAGWLAAINYAGYLSGALIASLISDLVLKDRLYRIGLVLAIFSTAVMGLTTDVTIWALSRSIAPRIIRSSSRAISAPFLTVAPSATLISAMMPAAGLLSAVRATGTTRPMVSSRIGNAPATAAVAVTVTAFPAPRSDPPARPPGFCPAPADGAVDWARAASPAMPGISR